MVVGRARHEGPTRERRTGGCSVKTTNGAPLRQPTAGLLALRRVGVDGLLRSTPCRER